MIRPEDIRNLLQRRPFQTIRIHMSNGAIHEIRHPDLAIVMRATIIVGRPEPGSENPIAEGYDVISVLHINRVEVLPLTPTVAASN